MSATKKILFFLLRVVGVTAFWCGIWCLISYRVANEFLFPSPVAVLRALGKLAVTKEFRHTASASLWRILMGILISLFAGILLAVATSRSKILKALLSPLLNAVKSTPVASFIILALLWISRDILPVFITSLIVVPIVWSNVAEGIGAVSKELLEVAQVYRLSPSKKMLRLYMPSVAPYFFAACKSSLGMAWKAGIAAEVLSTPKVAIGTELYFAKTYLETPDLFAWTLVIILLSLIIEKLLIRILEKLAEVLHISGRRAPHADT